MVIRAGIVGGAGYTAGELIRILIHHPKVKIDFIYSTSNAGNPVSKIHQDLLEPQRVSQQHVWQRRINIANQFQAFGMGF